MFHEFEVGFPGKKSLSTDCGIIGKEIRTTGNSDTGIEAPKIRIRGCR